MVSALYNQVDEEVHKLVILSNKSLQQLETLLELRTLQERHEEVNNKGVYYGFNTLVWGPILTIN